MNIIARLEYELAYYDSAVHRFNHYTTRTPPCPEEMGWEFGRFWKRFSWVPTMVLRSWCPTMVLRSWGPTMELKVDIGPWRQTVEYSAVAAAVKFVRSRPVKMNWDLKHHEMYRTLGMVCIVWIRKTFKNCVSLLVSKDRTQKLINGSYLNNGVAYAFVFDCICICICTVVFDIIEL